MRLWLIGLFVLACACGGETEGQSIAIRWNVEAADRAETDREFVTDTGWQVRLDTARVAVESMLALAPKKDSIGAVARVSRWFLPVAHAHGGHDEATGKRIRAEWLDPFVIDALAPERASLGSYSAEAGAVDMLKLELARTKTRLEDDLHGFRAYVAGTAERDGERVSFEGGLSFADEEPARRVETPVELELVEGGTLTLDVHVSEWLRDAEFDRLPGSDSVAPREIAPETQVGRAWAIGVRSPAAFSFSWNP
jgi:hypothetical protein